MQFFMHVVESTTSRLAVRHRKKPSEYTFHTRILQASNGVENVVFIKPENDGTCGTIEVLQGDKGNKTARKLLKGEHETPCVKGKRGPVGI